MSAGAEPPEDEGPRQEGAEGDAVLGDHPEAQEVDIRARFLLEDAQDEEVQL